MLVMRRVLVLGTLLLAAVPAGAADFYVDPVSGSASGDGSAARPWRTIEQVLSANLVESRRWERLPYVDGVPLVPRNPEGPAYDLALESSTVRSKAEVAGWMAADWNALAPAGLLVEADRVIVRDNLLENVERGISVGGSHCLIERNVVNRFTHDGMVGNGNYNTYQYNVIKN